MQLCEQFKKKNLNLKMKYKIHNGKKKLFSRNIIYLTENSTIHISHPN